MTVSAKAKRGGIPAFQPTADQRAQVEAAAACCVPQAEIVKSVVNPRTGKPISLMTLRATMREELDTGESRLKVRIAGKLAMALEANDKHVLIFLAKTKLGMRERMEIMGKDGGAIVIKVTPNEAAY